MWAHRPKRHRPPRGVGDWQATTPESVALSKELKRAGFRFVGPTTVYAAMQACGVVNDHLLSCHVREGVQREIDAVAR
jgi:DNA-3-methyladenine glycosylase I